MQVCELLTATVAQLLSDGEFKAQLDKVLLRASWEM